MENCEDIVKKIIHFLRSITKITKIIYKSSDVLKLDEVIEKSHEMYKEMKIAEEKAQNKSKKDIFEIDLKTNPFEVELNLKKFREKIAKIEEKILS